MSRLFFCGEALIDFIPVDAADHSTAFSPLNGGSPYNAAKAAACAGGDAWFIGAISRDLFGQQLIAHLTEFGVNCDLVLRSDHPTTLAFVDFSSGQPRYAFFNNDTATRNTHFPIGYLTPCSDDILHVGSISLIDNPGADNISNLCMNMADRMLVSVDPNVRPMMIRDRTAWYQRIDQILSVASIVRLSDEDLTYMDPSATPESFAEATIAGGAKLVIVTLGEAGAVAFTSQTSVRSASPTIELRDAVGAGDALLGAVLSRITSADKSVGNALRNLTQPVLQDILDFGTTAAALNCTKPGASPPSFQEIARFQQNGVREY